MQYLRLVLVLVLAVWECACSAPQRVLFTSDHIRDVRDQILVQAVHVGGGTGTAVWYRNGITYILTAGHVVDGQGFLDITFYENENFRGFTGMVCARSARYDLGLVAVPADIFRLGEMASDEEYRDLEEGDIVLSAGWPGTRPALVSIGCVRDPWYRDGNRGPFLYHSSPGWFGYSGGPVVSLKTGHVVGVVIEIRGEWGLWDTTLQIAVPAPHVNEFLFEVLDHERRP